MNTETILLLLLSLVLALVVSYFQYIYKVKKKDSLIFFLAFFRFLILFLIGVLLINPTIKSTSYQIEKPILSVVIDNSASIGFLKQEKNTQSIRSKLITNSYLDDKFDIRWYQFSDEIQILDTLTFKGKQSNIFKIADYFKKNTSDQNAPIVILTDGNSTLGEEYSNAFSSKNSVYPIVLGDTLQAADVYFSTINTNKYVLEGNQFPVELFVNYSGTKNVKSTLTIKNAKKSVVFKQQINFTPQSTTQQITAVLPSEAVGITVYTVELEPISGEKNTINNKKQFAIEVINQKTKIALISSIKHPDIGVLKKSILSNKLREVHLRTPQEIQNSTEYDLLIYYQPTTAFQQLFSHPKFEISNNWIITGKQTDYAFLNQFLKDFKIQSSNQVEEYLPSYNAQFGYFSVEENLFKNFPPLQNQFIRLNSQAQQEELLHSKVDGVDTGMPLFTLVEGKENRRAYLFGEGIWRWRLQNYKTNENFESFDLLIDQTVQYLTTNQKKKRLQVTHKQLYTTAESVEITAQFYDKNYKLDWNAILTVQVLNLETKKKIQYDMVRSEKNFKTTFENLASGNYSLTVSEKSSKNTYSSTFTVFDSDIEAHFSNANHKGLQRLAKATNGKVFYPDQIDQLINQLQNNSDKPIQKEITQSISLIEWRILLGLLVLFLAIEWLVRKYNGLL